MCNKSRNRNTIESQDYHETEGDVDWLIPILSVFEDVYNK